MKNAFTPGAPARPTPPQAMDMAALFGEWAALAKRPGEDSERLELAIRVVEALQRDEQAARQAARPAQ
jgi:hypothetical protein